MTTATPEIKDPSRKQLGKDKLARIPVKIEPTTERIKKPDWLKVRISSKPEDNQRINNLKKILRENRLFTVCEEASCPNLPECFGHGTATFMIMGDKCTRRCAFCDVGHGRPDALDPDEPINLAKTIAAMQLKYVVITSVDRDDLRDGGAGHFAECIRQIRSHCPTVTIETLVPDYRGRMDVAVKLTEETPPDIFNHNIETAPRLYKQARPGSDYQWSLSLLKEVKSRLPNVPTKSGMMLGLGETDEEVIQVMQDLRAHDVEMLTLGQYLQPTRYHLPVARFVAPADFNRFGDIAKELGFSRVASGPLVRSSYHADLQAAGETVA